MHNIMCQQSKFSTLKSTNLDCKLYSPVIRELLLTCMASWNRDGIACMICIFIGQHIVLLSLVTNFMLIIMTCTLMTTFYHEVHH
jgi:hypothetical protein